MLHYETIDTHDGPFTLIEDPDGAVVAAGWTAHVSALLARSRLMNVDAVPAPCASAGAVTAYYAGDPRALASVVLKPRGTDFQNAVWDVLRAIPPGEARTYGEVAAAIGNPAASRAVGAACGANRVALFVPCHRVTGASGALTGFAWGVDIKRALLEREARVLLST